MSPCQSRLCSSSTTRESLMLFCFCTDLGIFFFFLKPGCLKLFFESSECSYRQHLQKTTANWLAHLHQCHTSNQTQNRHQNCRSPFQEWQTELGSPLSPFVSSFILVPWFLFVPVCANFLSLTSATTMHSSFRCLLLLRFQSKLPVLSVWTTQDARFAKSIHPGTAFLVEYTCWQGFSPCCSEVNATSIMLLLVTPELCVMLICLRHQPSLDLLQKKFLQKRKRSQRIKESNHISGEQRSSLCLNQRVCAHALKLRKKISRMGFYSVDIEQ